MQEIERKLPDLPLKLKQEILAKGTLERIRSGTMLLKEGEYVRWVPLVLEGLIKVFGTFGEKELLLYYIKPSESCIMSFTSGLRHSPSQVFALAEEDSSVLLLPVEFVNEWVREFPSLNNLFLQQYHLRYQDLLETIHQLMYARLDQRIIQYLKERGELLDTRFLDIRHHQIAAELGTAREVVSRVMKKLEKEGRVIQHTNGIEII